MINHAGNLFGELIAHPAQDPIDVGILRNDLPRDRFVVSIKNMFKGVRIRTMP